MKILHLLFCCLFFFTFSINSQVKSLKVLTDHHFYLDPSSGEYIELAFQFDSENIHFVKSKFDYSANISLKIIVSQDSTDFVNSTYLIDSPKFRDSLFEDFIDVRRFLLKPGKYLLSLSFKDINSSQLAVKSSQFIIVPDLHSKISISDIQVCENIRESKQDNMLTKSGHDLFPRLLNYFSSACKFLPSYLEIYNPFKDSLFISLKTSYYSIDNKKELNHLTKVKHFKLGEITPIIQKNEISDLPTGSYKLVYSVLKDSIELCKELGEEEIFIIGGAQIYDLALQTLPIDTMYITHVNAAFPDAHAVFPSFNVEEWNASILSEHPKDEAHAYSFVIKQYDRK